MAPRPANASPIASLLLATLVAPGCEFGIPDASYIGQTRLLAVHAEVVEVGELNPDRVGGSSSLAITEAMPGDRLAFDAHVVDAEGRRLGADELDTLWLQCGTLPCGGLQFPVNGDAFAQDCATLPEPGWTTDHLCRLGTGDGHFEFEVPALGPAMVATRIAYYYGVIAWDGQRAESCWAHRLARDEVLDGCQFVRRPVKIGPSWWMLAYGEALGFESPVPIGAIPAPAYEQLANRLPAIEIDVVVDGALAGQFPGQTLFTVEPGAAIQLSVGWDEAEQINQLLFVARSLEDGTLWHFELAYELLFPRYFSTGDLRVAGETSDSGAFTVDPRAQPGRSRLFVVYYDDRWSEGVATLEFEVAD